MNKHDHTTNDTAVTEEEYQEILATKATPLIERALVLMAADHEGDGEHHQHLPIMNDDGFMLAISYIFNQKLPAEVIEMIGLHVTVELALYLVVAAQEPREAFKSLMGDIEVEL